jgi:hypothetical protein
VIMQTHKILLVSLVYSTLRVREKFSVYCEEKRHGVNFSLTLRVQTGSIKNVSKYICTALILSHLLHFSTVGDK